MEEPTPYYSGFEFRAPISTSTDTYKMELYKDQTIYYTLYVNVSKSEMSFQLIFLVPLKTQLLF